MPAFGPISNARYVALPTSGQAPGKPGDYAVDADNHRVIHYTGDGVSNHSWGATELVNYNP